MKTKEQWIKENPNLNPDFMTDFGPTWSISDKQRKCLQRQENEQVCKDEMYFNKFIRGE